jgi:hypothetical protein
MRPIKILAAALLLLAASCVSGPPASSGYWDENDVKIVCESMIRSCLNSPRVIQEIQNKKGKIPTVLVGRFSNEASDEHINTSIIADMMEIAIFNSGKMNFVAGGATRDAIRAERQDQQAFASEETAASLAKEAGADFMLFGSVKTIVEKTGNKTKRAYFVSAELTNVETNARLWMNQNTEIIKTTVRPKNKL